jgi:hypothetical protein
MNWLYETSGEMLLDRPWENLRNIKAIQNKAHIWKKNM